MHQGLLRTGAALSLLAGALAGCSRDAPPSEPETGLDLNDQADAAPDPAPPPPVVDTPPPAPPAVTENTAFAIPPEEAIPPSDQILDDADATGMTARLPPADDTAPADADRTDRRRDSAK